MPARQSMRVLAPDPGGLGGWHASLGLGVGGGGATNLPSTPHANSCHLVLRGGPCKSPETHRASSLDSGHTKGPQHVDWYRSRGCPGVHEGPRQQKPISVHETAKPLCPFRPPVLSTPTPGSDCPPSDPDRGREQETPCDQDKGPGRKGPTGAVQHDPRLTRLAVGAGEAQSPEGNVRSGPYKTLRSDPNLDLVHALLWGFADG